MDSLRHGPTVEVWGSVAPCASIAETQASTDNRYC